MTLLYRYAINYRHERHDRSQREAPTVQQVFDGGSSASHYGKTSTMRGTRRSIFHALLARGYEACPRLSYNERFHGYSLLSALRKCGIKMRIILAYVAVKRWEQFTGKKATLETQAK